MGGPPLRVDAALFFPCATAREMKWQLLFFFPPLSPFTHFRQTRLFSCAPNPDPPAHPPPSSPCPDSRTLQLGGDQDRFSFSFSPRISNLLFFHPQNGFIYNTRIFTAPPPPPVDYGLLLAVFLKMAYFFSPFPLVLTSLTERGQFGRRTGRKGDCLFLFFLLATQELAADLKMLPFFPLPGT